MSVTDIGNILSQQFVLGVLRGKVDEISRQSSTGKKSDSITGMGANAVASSISYRNTSKLLDSYTNNLNTLKSRLSITDTTLTSVTKAARDFVAQLRSQLQDTTPSASILSNSATGQIQVLSTKLNTQFDGRYIFSGADFDAKPFDSTSQLMTNIGTVVTAALTDPATTTASVITSAQAVSTNSLGVNSDAMNGGNVNVRVDNGTNLSITLNINEPGFSDILRGMAIVANLPQPTTSAEQENYWDMINSAISLIEGGATSVDQAQAVLGDKAKTVDNLLKQHDETQANLETYISSVEDVDMADAATRFSALQTQLQTSYSIIATLKNLSLINYL